MVRARSMIRPALKRHGGAWKVRGVVPDAVTLEGFLYANFCVTATEQMLDNSIMQDVLGNLQQGTGSDVRDGEIPCNFEVLDAIDVLRRCESPLELQDAMQFVWAYERSARPSLTTKQKQKVEDYFQRK